MSRTLRALVALALLLPVAQAQRGVLPRPNAESGPTEIEVGIYVNDIIKVDGAEQLLTADFFLVQRWRDPGQAGGEPRSVPSDSVWMPNVQVVNEARLFTKLPDLIEVDAEGNLRKTQRYVGTLTNRLALRDFPFDRQLFRIEVATGKTREQVQFRSAEDMTGQRSEFTIADWMIGPGQAVDAPYIFAPTGEAFPGLAYELPAKRRLAFYLWKGIVPLGLVVLMAFSAFWVDPKEDLIVIFMTQLMPSRTFNFRGQLKSIIYPAIID